MENRSVHKPSSPGYNELITVFFPVSMSYFLGWSSFHSYFEQLAIGSSFKISYA